MEVGKTLAQLQYEAERLGIQVTASGKNGRVMKRDFVEPLMMYSLVQKYGTVENVPRNVRFRLSFDCPQLACGYFDLGLLEQDNIWVNDHVWLVEKINGVRGTLVYSKEGFNCFSRALSDNDYMYVDYIEKIVQGWLPLSVNCAFDIEIVVGNRAVVEYLQVAGFEAGTDFQIITTLLMMDDRALDEVKKAVPDIFRFKLLDVYYWEKDLRKLSYREREKLFDEAVHEMKKSGIGVSRPMVCKESSLKKAFHEGVIGSGGEGTIAVYVDNPAILDGSRKKGTMVKIKKSLFSFGESVLTDTVDGWVSALKMNTEYNMVSEIEVSAYTKTGSIVRVAEVQAIPLSLRQSGMLKEGCVVEVSGSEWKDGLIQDSSVVRIRFDKGVESCVIY